MDETFDADIYVSDVDKLANQLLSEQADIVEGPTDRICQMHELLMRVATAMSLPSGKDEVPRRAAPPMSKIWPFRVLRTVGK
jgi:hypothetical protein